MQEEITDFINWTKLKIRIHLKKENLIPYFKEREIWWASLGKNIGTEQNGVKEIFERPVLVLKKFNKRMLWCLPLTKKKKTHKFQCIIGSSSYVILSQLRLISSKRLVRKMKKISKKDFDIIKDNIKKLL